MGAPASALYSLPDTSGVLAASRAGTGDLYAQVVVCIGIGGHWYRWYRWLLVWVVLVALGSIGVGGIGIPHTSGVLLRDRVW